MDTLRGAGVVGVVKSSFAWVGGWGGVVKPRFAMKTGKGPQTAIYNTTPPPPKRLDSGETGYSL